MRTPRDPGKTSSTEAERDDGFLRRWSQRKARVRAGVEPAEPVPAPAEPAVLEGEGTEVLDAEPRVLTDADMPPLESLDSNSDYSPFMSPGVSDALRRVALRKFFHSPEFNELDMLDDYCEDFTTWEPLGDTVTAEMRFRANVAIERAREKAEAEARAALADAVPEPAPGDLPATAEAPESIAEAAPESIAETAPQPAPDAIPAEDAAAGARADAPRDPSTTG